MAKPTKRPRVLLFDIETAPIIAHVWGLFDQNVGLNQIQKDWHILSWAAKWLGDKTIMYADQRKARKIENDRRILKGIWKLLDDADIVVTQNGKQFDVKKLNARFIIHGFPPPSPFKHIDTLQISRKTFGFTSNRLEYLATTLKAKDKKLTKREFEGFTLWKECLAGNMRAWREMEKYNKLDVLALEHVYKRLIPWDSTLNFNLFRSGTEHVCTCGSRRLQRRGFHYSQKGKFQIYRCLDCGKWTRSSQNLLSKEKRDSLHVSAK